MNFLKRLIVIVITISLLLFVASIAFAADITPKQYNRSGEDWSYYSHGQDKGYDFPGETTSTHLYGTWNNPFKAGIDAYNYNDNQAYKQLSQGGILFVWGESISGVLDNMGIHGDQQKMYFPYVIPASMMPQGQGPHGGYATSTHKCRDCHAVHRASGKFKLTRADTRQEACDWCHGMGAGSGYNIQTDNDDEFSREYNVGHTMGFGTSDGKFKAPNDTYPAYTPKYYLGGFSCFDCHTPHGNPSRLFGYIDMGRMMYKPGLPSGMFPDSPDNPAFVEVGVQAPGFISNPGAVDHNTFMYVPWPLNERRPDYEVTMTLAYPNLSTGGYIYVDARVMNVSAAMGQPWLKAKSIFPGGRWLLIQNPDTEILNGQEIRDVDTSKYTFPGDGNTYPVNKTKTSWDWPFGTVSEDDMLGDNNGNFINPI